jgi:hypothetical protein
MCCEVLQTVVPKAFDAGYRVKISTLPEHCIEGLGWLKLFMDCGVCSPFASDVDRRNGRSKSGIMQEAAHCSTPQHKSQCEVGTHSRKQTIILGEIDH